jgi:hypothetical protein
VSRFLEWLSRAVQRAYRTTASQSRAKPSLEDASRLHEFLTEAAAKHARGKYADAVTRLRPLFKDFSVAATLYRDFRSASIHQVDFRVADRFFREPGTYFATAWWAIEGTGYLDLQFSARWLVQLLRDITTNYASHLAATEKLPLGMWSEVCSEDELGYLDVEHLDLGREIGFSLGR